MLCHVDKLRTAIIMLFSMTFIPTAFAESPDEYQIGLSLINIGEIDKKIGTYEMDFWYSVSSDKQDLTVNPPPEVDFINGKIDDARSEFKNPQIIEKRMSGKFSSDLNFRDFPFEKIRLPIKIEPLPQWSTNKVVFIVNPASGVDESASVPGWSVTESNFNIVEKKYGNNTYSQFVAEYVIQRDPLGSFLKTILTILMVLGFSFIAYIIPKNHDIVVELSLLPLLALVFFHINTLDQLPPLGYLTIFDKLMLLSYILIGNNVIAAGRQIRAGEFSGEDRAWYLNNFHLKLTPVLLVILIPVLFFVL